jgi:hypothetical protein
MENLVAGFEEAVERWRATLGSEDLAEPVEVQVLEAVVKARSARTPGGRANLSLEVLKITEQRIVAIAKALVQSAGDKAVLVAGAPSGGKSGRLGLLVGSPRVSELVRILVDHRATIGLYSLRVNGGYLIDVSDGELGLELLVVAYGEFEPIVARLSETEIGDGVLFRGN